MIVGSGLIALLFAKHDREDTIFFASGVSNSLETEKEQFLREENLIRKTISQNHDKMFVYFSTCSIYDSSKANSPYVLHKLRMEQVVSEHCPKNLILRLSNAVGRGGNPNLLINYLMRSIQNNQVIDVYTEARRNLIDTKDVRNITLKLLDKKLSNRVINIAHPENYSIIEILEIIKKIFDTKINLNLIKSGSGYNISISSEIKDYFIKNNLLDKDIYLCSVLKKYYF